MSNACAPAGLEKSGKLNTDQMAQAKTHATAALEAAKGGDAPGVVEHAKAGWNMCKNVIGQTEPYYEGAMEKLTAAISVADEGDTVAAVPLLEAAVAKTSEGQANADY
jgi:hypothetical protein